MLLSSRQGKRPVYPVTLLLLVSSVVADNCGDNARRKRDDSGDDDSNCTSSSHHFSHTTSSTRSSQPSDTGTPVGDFGTSHSGVSKGGIAGIVIAVVLGSLLLLLLILCLHRRRRQRRRLRLEDGTSVLAATSHETKDSLLRTADASPDTRTYGNIPPSTANIDSAAVPLVAAAALAGHAGHRTRESSGADLMRSPTTSSLPNPHDMHDEPLLMPTMHSSRNVDRDLPPVPVEHTDVPDVSRLSSTFSSRSSYPPSSFSDPAAFLTRGNTSRTTASTASTLHSEMAVYQKRLEAHHEKEMQARDDAAPSGGLPLEPPPEYQETLPMNSTSDLGEISHGTDAHRE